MNTTKRSPLPPLHPNLPSCPLCGLTVHWDGYYKCPSCNGTWESDAYDAEGEADSSLAQCLAEVEPYADDDLPNIAHYRYRCVKNAGHPVDMGLTHVGVRSDGARDDGEPYEWFEGDHPQWTSPAGDS
jgi:hypothetical protein